MASKSYVFSVDNRVTGTSTLDRNKGAYLMMRDGISGALTYVDESNSGTTHPDPYVVVASSNAVTANTSDNWTTRADIVSAAVGVAHSWWHGRIVDYFGSGDHLHILIAAENDAKAAEGYVAYVRGATGWNNDGTTTNRPTVEAGKVELKVRRGLTHSGNADASDSMWSYDNNFIDLVFNFKISTDGQVCRWWAFAGGNEKFFAGFQPLEDAVGATVNPDGFVAFYAAQDTQTLEPRDFTDVWDQYSLGYAVDAVGAIKTIAMMQPQAFLGGAANTFSSLNDNGTPGVAQLYLVDVSGVASYGIVTDMWVGSDLKSTGDQSPATGTIQYTQIGTCVERTPDGVVSVVT